VTVLVNIMKNVGRKDLPSILAQDGQDQERDKEGITKEEFIQRWSKVPACAPGQNELMRAYDLYYGWDVVQSDQCAAQQFQSAADAGSPEGMLELAGCHHKQFNLIRLAFQTYLKAANMDPNTPGRLTKANKNYGVAAAQYFVGHFYEKGLGTDQDQDYAKAATWYRKAAKNGESRGAFCLGKLNFSGLGMVKNEKKAERLWIRAVELGNAKAARALLGLYLQDLDLEKATQVYRTGRGLEDLALQGISDKEFQVVIQDYVLKREHEGDAVNDAGMTSNSDKSLQPQNGQVL